MSDKTRQLANHQDQPVVHTIIIMPQTTKKKKAKEDASRNKTGTVRWRKYGPHAAQLFRDIYFKKYTPKEDDKFDVDTIFNDPIRDYDSLSRGSFYQHVEEIADRVQTYREKGTGLGTQEFRELVNIRKLPPPEERGRGWKEDNKSSDADEESESKASESDKEEEALSSSGSDDSSYFGVKEDDVSLDSAFEKESSAEEEDVDKTPAAKMSSTKKTPKKTPKKSKTADVEEIEEAMKKATLKDNNDVSGDTKYMYKMADGRICCVFQLPSGFEGNFEFGKGKVKQTVVLKREMPRWCYSARRVFRRKGFGPNDANVVELQTLMDKQKKADIEAMGMDAETYSGSIYSVRKVFDVTDLGVAEVLPYFLDEYGNRTTDIYADAGNGAEWVFFWLRDKETVKESHPGGRIIRNRTRTRDHSDDEGDRPRGRQSAESNESGFHDAMSTVST